MTQEQRERLEELAAGRGLYVTKGVDRQLQEDGLIVVADRRNGPTVTAPTQKAIALLRQAKTEGLPPPAPPTPCGFQGHVEIDPAPPAPLDEPLEGEAVDDRPFEHYPEDNPHDVET